MALEQASFGWGIGNTVDCLGVLSVSAGGDRPLRLAGIGAVGQKTSVTEVVERDECCWRAPMLGHGHLGVEDVQLLGMVPLQGRVSQVNATRGQAAVYLVGSLLQAIDEVLDVLDVLDSYIVAADEIAANVSGEDLRKCAAIMLSTSTDGRYLLMDNWCGTTVVGDHDQRGVLWSAIVEESTKEWGPGRLGLGLGIACLTTQLLRTVLSDDGAVANAVDIAVPGLLRRCRCMRRLCSRPALLVSCAQIGSMSVVSWVKAVARIATGEDSR